MIGQAFYYFKSVTSSRPRHGSIGRVEPFNWIFISNSGYFLV